MTPKPKQPPQFPPFPSVAFSGSVGELSWVLTEGTEVPREFAWAACMTYMGALCSGKVELKGIDTKCETRLYSVLYGASGDSKKSTALRKAQDFFSTLNAAQANEYRVLSGLSSAEGLVRCLGGEREKGEPNNNLVKNVIVTLDELKAVVDKTHIKGSVLLPLIASLYEQGRWEVPVKDPNESFIVRNAKLSIVGCSTMDTYSSMWTSESIAIGLHNRLFLVGGERSGKVAWPKAPDPERLNKLRYRITKQLERLAANPLVFEVDDDARETWERFYSELPDSLHTKRLDTLGFRLLPLVALTNDKQQIDLATVQCVTELLRYELQMRIIADPIDADNKLAEMEIKIRRQLEARGALKRRELQNFVNYTRAGLPIFNQAFSNLISNQEVRQRPEDRRFELACHSD